MSDINGFKIEKGIPCPGPYGRGRPRKYPLREMVAGDSFLLVEDGVHTETLRRRMTAFAKNENIKIATRNEGAGIRVWRLA